MQSRGWHYRWLDTGRVINLQLLLSGYTLKEPAVPELHHAGGFSLRDYYGSRGGLRRAAAIVRSSADGRRFRRLADGAATRLNATRGRRSRRGRISRRRLVLDYLDQVLHAVRANDPLPPAPDTGSPEVDRGVAGLVSAIEMHYPPGLAVLGEVAPLAATRQAP